MSRTTQNFPLPMSALVSTTVAMRSATCKCGEVFEQRRITETLWAPTVCAACVHASEQAEAETREKEDRRRRREFALKALDVPLLYSDATLDNFRTHGDAVDRQKQSRVLQLARRYLAGWHDRQNLQHLGGFPVVAIFRGAPGSGKGHVAWSIAKHVALTELGKVVFTTLADCVRDLRETWRRDSEASENQRLARYRRADLLILDEVSAHSFYGEPTQHLYSLVAYREERLLPTILTTNESPDALAQLIGPALESRAASWGEIWQFGDADYRIARRNARREVAA